MKQLKAIKSDAKSIDAKELSKLAILRPATPSNLFHFVHVCVQSFLSVFSSMGVYLSIKET